MDDCKKFVIVFGCLANIQYEKVKKVNPKAIIIQNDSIDELIFILRYLKKFIYFYDSFTAKIAFMLNLRSSKKNNNILTYSNLYLNSKKNRINKNIHICQISKGCSLNCSYCIVRKAKGNLFSFNPDDIIEDIKYAINSGCNEIWITSQDNAQYGLDFKENTKYYNYKLTDLLDSIIKLDGNFKIRIGMVNPLSVFPILENLINIYEKSDKIYKVLHLPIQSASNNVLKNMNRKHDIKLANEIINKFRSKIPSLSLITDLIVGFCYETDNDFKITTDWI